MDRLCLHRHKLGMGEMVMLEENCLWEKGRSHPRSEITLNLFMMENFSDLGREGK